MENRILVLSSAKNRKGFTLVELIVGIIVIGIAVANVVPIFMGLGQRSVDTVMETKANLLAYRIIKQINKTSFDEYSDHNGTTCRCGEKIYIPNTDINICSFVGNKNNDGNCTLEKDYGVDSIENINVQESISSYFFNDVDDFKTSKICENNNSLATECKSNDLLNLSVCKNNERCLISANYFIDQHDSTLNSTYNSTLDDLLSNTEINYKDLPYEDFYVFIDVKKINLYDKEFKKVLLTVVTPSGELFEYNLIKGNY